MDRREAGEELYRKKFAECGLDALFDFIKRDWNSDHGRKMIVRCKTCGLFFRFGMKFSSADRAGCIAKNAE